ncbi:MAG: hypothetical protein JM58_13725 [Peptococcaceae bacterium BICA1-8]|nr:MAG: hypothetical protein JM58_13725 [Peptococcaceae bacterium BICA1-8]
MINHTYIIYSFAGSALGIFLITVFIRLGFVSQSGDKAKLYLSTLFLPVLIYIGYFWIFNKPCTAELLHVDSFLSRLCAIGYWFLDYLIPVLILILFLVLFKTLISSWYTRTLIKRHRIVDGNIYSTLINLVETLCEKVNIKIPQLIIIPTTSIKAFVFGFRSQYLVLSRGLIESLTEDELLMVLAHEVSHLKRKDFLTNWLSVFFRDVMFFNPLVYWLFNKYLAEIEKRADNDALELYNKPSNYALTLIKLYKIKARTSFSDYLLASVNPYPSFFAGTSVLEDRVENVLKFNNSKTSVNRNARYLNGFIIFVTLIILALIC